MCAAPLHDTLETIEDLEDMHLTFYLGETVYALPLCNVIEIVDMHTITKVPNLPNTIKGIINLRGKILPVIDGRLRLHLPPEEYDTRTSIIIMNYHGMFVGLIVDRVYDVVRASEGNIAKPELFGKNTENRLLASVLLIQTRVVLCLDCEKLLDSTAFSLER